MHAYTFVPLVACVVLSTLALSIWTRAFGSVVRPIGVLFGAAAFWAFCEVLWNMAPDAATATFVQRLSAPGWMLLGPLCLDGFVAGTPARSRTRPWLRGLYTASRESIADRIPPPPTWVELSCQ